MAIINFCNIGPICFWGNTKSLSYPMHIHAEPNLYHYSPPFFPLLWNGSPIKGSGKSQPKRNFLSLTKGAFGKLWAHFKFYLIYCGYTMIIVEVIHLGALVHGQIIISRACFYSSYMWLELNSKFHYKSITARLYFVSGLQSRTIDFPPKLCFFTNSSMEL